MTKLSSPCHVSGSRTPKTGLSGRPQSKPMTMRRKPQSHKRIKPTIPLLRAKNEAKSERKIPLATDETRIEHG